MVSLSKNLVGNIQNIKLSQSKYDLLFVVIVSRTNNRSILHSMTLDLIYFTLLACIFLFTNFHVYSLLVFVGFNKYCIWISLCTSPFSYPGKKKPQLIILDHGLYKDLDFHTRTSYAALWKVCHCFLENCLPIFKYGFLFEATCLFPCLHICYRH